MSLPKPWPSMNRICGSTVINSGKKIVEQRLKSEPTPLTQISTGSADVNGISSRLNLQSFILVTLTLLLLSGCTSTPEVSKIGLLAPFEGLYRRSGYSALAAMRAALEDAGAANLAILPLALDDGDDPEIARRSAEKLLADPTVVAVVGPLTPWAAAGAAPALSEMPHWLPPFAVTPATGFVDPRDGHGWADAWIAATAAAIQAEDAARLTVAGWRPGWPDYDAAALTAITGMPVVMSHDPAAVQEGDAVLWLGSAADGADYLNRLRMLRDDTPFWLGMQGADPVFAERAVGLQNVYWTMWAPIGYNPEIAPNFPDTPDAQIVYVATLTALYRIAAGSSPAPQQWQLQTFDLSSGSSVPVGKSK
jgi:hypothetical protein